MATGGSEATSNGVPGIPINTCDIHEDKILNMYCVIHDIVGCTSCMTKKHRNCGAVQLVPGVIDTLFKESLVMEIHQKLLEMISQTEEIRTSKEKCLEELKKTGEKAINEIKEFRKELETILENPEEQSTKEIERCFNQLQLTLKNENEKADNELQIMKKSELHLMKSEGNKAQQFVSVKVSKQKIAKTEEMLQALQPCTDSRISFVRDSNLTKYLQQLKSLGSVRHEQKSSAYVIKTAWELNVKTQNDSKYALYLDLV